MTALTYLLVVLMVAAIVVGALGGAGVFNPKATAPPPANDQLSSIYNMLRQQQFQKAENDFQDQGLDQLNQAFGPQRGFNPSGESNSGSSCGSCKRGPFIPRRY